MSRRYWPAALAILALFLFGSYLAYTQHLVRQIREQSLGLSEMYAAVQRGLVSLQDGAELEALWELQGSLLALGVPFVLTDADGRIVDAQNLPFNVGLETIDGRRRVQAYATELRARRRYITTPGISTVYYGNPPIVSWLQWVPWLQASGGILLVLIAVAIIRSNVRAERERMWAAMARELAHQMGTPLSSLSGWIEVLHLPPDQRAALASEAHIGSVLSADVERLERVSRRFELIGKRPALQPIEVEGLLRELENYYRPRLPRLGGAIELRVRVRHGLPQVQANAVLLVWALENIIKNAVDALAGRKGKILLSVLGDPQNVQVRVSDNGPGIAPEVRGRIFEPGVSTKSGGWGVGLSLTQRIIEDLHGGRITVRERKRGGTTFEIELPATGHKLRRGFLARR
ncbi:MAG: sensor histidine kinase [Longimicrobiales bacterium]